jgi:hypothetical protein
MSLFRAVHYLLTGKGDPRMLWPENERPPVADAAANTEGVELFDGLPITTGREQELAARAIPPQMLLNAQKDLIKQIQHSSTLSKAEFEDLIYPVLLNYAGYVHLLPASEATHHYVYGGLLCHGLEVARNAGHLCEGVNFAFDEWPSKRHKLIPRWRAAAIIGGLVHDLGKAIVDIGAQDYAGGHIWTPHSTPLYEWLQTHNIREYHTYWQPGTRRKRHETQNTMLLHAILPDRTRKWLDAEGDAPSKALAWALTGDDDPNNPLVQLLKKADKRSVEEDIERNRHCAAGSSQSGSRSLPNRLIRSMHDFIERGEWKLNTLGSPIFVTRDGIFGLFPGAIAGAVDGLRKQGDTSVPMDLHACLQALRDAHHLAPYITPEGGEKLTCIGTMQVEDRGKTVPFQSHMFRLIGTDVIPRSLVLPAEVPIDVAPIGSTSALRSLGGDASSPMTTPVTTTAEAPVTSPIAAVPTDPVPSPTDNPSVAPSPDRESATPTPTVTSTATPTPSAAATAPKPRVSTSPPKYIRPVPPAPESAVTTPPVDDVPVLPSDFADPASDSDVAFDDEPAVTTTPASPPPADPAPLRDRSKEKDIRVQVHEDAYTLMKAEWPPKNAADAETWLHSHGDAGLMLISIAKMLAVGALVENTDLFDDDKHISLRHPSAFERHGRSATEVRELIEAVNWVQREPQSGGAFHTDEHDGIRMKVMRLTEECSTAFRWLLPARGQATPQNKRPMPLGPFIDELKAARLRDLVGVDFDDSALIRVAFHGYLDKKIQPLGLTHQELTAEDIAKQLRDFCKAHRAIKVPWLVAHLKEESNPMLVLAESAGFDSFISRNNNLRYNPKYHYDQDLAV